MSKDGSPLHTAHQDGSAYPSTVLHSTKSYRRKYRKIMVKFERQMRESSSLFKDQQRLYDISQRIAEQNDQILALLLELNSHPQIPSSMRYDLHDPATRKQPEKHENEQAALEALRTTRYKVQKGEVRQPDYEELEHILLDSVEFGPKQSYADLIKGGPLQRAQDDHPDSTSPLLGGFLSGKQEEHYLQALDDFLDGKASSPRAHAMNNLGSRNTEKSADRDRETQLRNPVSVYNWLRKNQPQVFLQDTDNDNLKAKVAAAAASRKSKRESLAKAPKTEPDLYDDEGIAIDPGNKGKRKRDEDGGYRPKGGHARPVKRRKEDSGKRSKRASMDIST